MSSQLAVVGFMQVEMPGNFALLSVVLASQITPLVLGGACPGTRYFR
jgi:hypothetical protein